MKMARFREFFKNYFIFFPQRAVMCAFDLLYLGETIENMEGPTAPVTGVVCITMFPFSIYELTFILYKHKGLITQCVIRPFNNPLI